MEDQKRGKSDTTTGCHAPAAGEAAEDVLIRVAALSLDIEPGNVVANLAKTGEMLAQLPADTDVAVLPELFTTAFMIDTDALKRCAEPSDGITVKTLKQWSAKYDLMLSGSFICREPRAEGREAYFNRGFMVFPSGDVLFYDKHHLFCLSAESRVFTHGRKRPPVVQFRGWNISMNICYELRFPVWCRNVENRTDMVLVPANWPQSRGFAWRHLLQARAIENQVVMVGADCSGTDEFGRYDGLTAIVDELGRIVSPPQAVLPEMVKPPTAKGRVIDTSHGPIAWAEMSLATLKKLRRYLPTVCDADSFVIHHAEVEVEE